MAPLTVSGETLVLLIAVTLLPIVPVIVVVPVPVPLLVIEPVGLILAAETLNIPAPLLF